MEHRVEDPLKRAVLGKGLVINFEAIVSYRNDPTTATNKEISQSPDQYRFDHIDFRAEQLVYNPAAAAWQVSAHPDPDVAAVDHARINWKYGGLPPLVQKPRILDPNTTWKDLVAVEIPPGAAKRIAKFIQASKGKWAPAKSTDKQGQLLAAVKAWDGMKRRPSNDWDATAVYWT